jgi:hypothetical protein
MLGLDAMSSYILVVALVALLAALLISQFQRSQKAALGTLGAAVLGVLLGAAGSFAAARLAGYEMEKPSTAVASTSVDTRVPPPGAVGGDIPPPAVAPPPKVGKMAGKGGGAPGKGGGMPGMGGMGGGGFGPRPKRDLTALVRKLELLSGNIGITFSPTQAAAISDCLKDVEKAESMSDDEAKAKHDKLLSLLDDAQKSRVAAIDLPRPQRPGGPGGAGPGGPGGKGPGGFGGKGPGGPGEDPDANPFKQETDAKALDGLRHRLAPKEEAEKTPPKKS